MTVKTDVKELKECLNFIEKRISHGFSNLNENKQNLEKELLSKKEDLGVTQIRF